MITTSVAAPSSPLTSTTRTVSAKSCGKVILFGEHAVVYGARAIAVPLNNLDLTVSIEVGELSTSYDIQLTLGDHEPSPILNEVVARAAELAGIPPCQIQVSAKTRIPVGAGLGSSAALCVALLRAFIRYSGKVISPEHLASEANQLEAYFHGNPSGLDTATIARARPVCYRRNNPSEFTPLLIDKEKPFHFLLIDSGTRASTKAMVAKAEPWFRADPNRVQEFDLVSQQAMVALKNGDEDELSRLMRKSYKLLSACGVTNRHLDKIVDMATEFGALAAKPTGACGGGMILALLPRDNANQVESRIRGAFLNTSMNRFTF